MKQISSNLKKGEIKIKVENLDDLWVLSQVIEQGDLVSGKTLRKIKTGGDDQRSQKVTRKPVFLRIKVEKIEFAKNSDSLRALGTIEEGPDDIAFGTHHSFNIEENTEIKIIKAHWLSYQIDKIKESCAETSAKILMCVMDREEAYFAMLKKYGYDVLSNIKGNVQKKGDDNVVESTFYQDVTKQIEDYVKKYKINKVIIASPSFWKEDLMKKIKSEELKGKISLATCSSVTAKAFDEVLKRGEVKNVLQEDRVAKEANYVEELLKEIKKDDLAVYGVKESKKAADAGAIKVLLVADSLINKYREAQKFRELEKIMKAIEMNKGEVHIISTEHEAGKKLEGLGGIGGLLRYKVNY